MLWNKGSEKKPGPGRYTVKIGNLELNSPPPPTHPILKILVSKCSFGRPEHSENSFRPENSKFTELWQFCSRSINQSTDAPRAYVYGQPMPSKSALRRMIDWLIAHIRLYDHRLIVGFGKERGSTCLNLFFLNSLATKFFVKNVETLDWFLTFSFYKLRNSLNSVISINQLIVPLPDTSYRGTHEWGLSVDWLIDGKQKAS